MPRWLTRNIIKFDFFLILRQTATKKLFTKSKDFLIKL